MKLDARDIIVGGLLLPLRLYFRPRSFADEVDSYGYTSDYDDDYGYWEAGRRFDDAAFLGRIFSLMLKSLVTAILALVIIYCFSLLGFPVRWRWGIAGVVAGIIISVVNSVAGGTAAIVAFGVAFGVGLANTRTVIGGVAVSAAVGVISSIGVKQGVDHA
jgi:hypothetical protein